MYNDYLLHYYYNNILNRISIAFLLKMLHNLIMKKSLRALLIILFILLVIPYFIPTEFNQTIPELPYSNSVFFQSSDNISLHAQIYPYENEYQGKILFIHGLGASSASFRNNAPFFAQQGYQVISIDLPAFGYSSKESGIDHSQTNRARLIWEFLDNYDIENNLDDSWHLVGHSMGGSTVLAMAEQKPNKVHSINLIAGAVTQENSSNKWLFYTPIGQWLKVGLRYFLINDTQFNSFLESASAQKPSKETVELYLVPFKTKGTINALIDFVKTSDNFLIEEFTQKNIPINLFWGKKDTWVSVDTIEIIKKYVKVNSIELFNDGHLLHETSLEFNQKLLDKLILP